MSHAPPAALRLALLLVPFAAACGDGPTEPPGRDALVERYGLEPMPAMMFPAENPPDSARIELGRVLFFDPIQSAGMDVACSTCHLPRFGTANTPDGFMFWDGRKRRLENLVTLPQTEFSEMRGDAYPVGETTDTVLKRLRAVPEYEALFRAAFPERAAAVDRGERTSAVDSLAWAQALAQFVRSVTSTDSRYDRFVTGDAEALTEAERRGLVP